MSGQKKIEIDSPFLYRIFTENNPNHNYVLVEKNTEGVAGNIGSRIGNAPRTAGTNSKKPVEGKDLIVGREYFENDTAIFSLGNFVGKSSEYFDDGPHGHGTVIYYVFRYGVNKKKIRYCHGEEIFYTCP